MVSTPRLHPSVRERLEPRMSATALAEYLILQPDGQENILHDSRFSRPPVVAANADALRALRSYNCDPKRDQLALDRVKGALMMKASDLAVKPKSRDESRRCAEAIELFLRNENILGTRALALRESPQFDAFDVEGVTLSVRPDFLVEGSGGRIGAGIIRVAKAPDPAACKLDETRTKRGDHRREMARYLVAMLQLLLENQGRDFGIIDRDLCFVADIRIPERVGPAPDHANRIKAIRGACRQIVTLWPSINPKPSVFAR